MLLLGGESTLCLYNHIVKTSPLFNLLGAPPLGYPLGIPPSLWGCFGVLGGGDVLHEFSR